MATPLPCLFAAGPHGEWRIDSVRPVVGEDLPFAERLAVHEGFDFIVPKRYTWILRGVTSNIRYTHSSEAAALAAKQAGLARPDASCAALITIRKKAEWWNLAQDERRRIFEEQSRHIAIGLDYLPGVARRLHHSRDLGEEFDFLTWFEFAPAQTDAFDDMIRRLRDTEEWRYVEREVDIRLIRSDDVDPPADSAT